MKLQRYLLTKLIQLQRYYLFYENMQPKKNPDKNGEVKLMKENCAKKFFLMKRNKNFFHVCTQGRLCISATPHQ